MRKLFVLVAAAAVVIPGSALAKPKPDKPAKPETPVNSCREMRQSMGTTAFRQAYGTNHNRANAMGKCRSAERHALKTAHANAVTTCRGERTADPDAFTATYGTGKHGRNAFGRCVSQHASDAAARHHDAVVNAARTCRSERGDDPDAFKEKYGTGPRMRNAFGRCVRQTARKHAA